MSTARSPSFYDNRVPKDAARNVARRRSLPQFIAPLASRRGLFPKVGRNDREVDPVVKPPSVLVGEDEKQRLRTGGRQERLVQDNEGGDPPMGSTETSVTVMKSDKASSVRGWGGAVMRVRASSRFSASMVKPQ